MINLLPDDAKKQIKAGRTNVILMKYLFTLGISIAFLAAISIGSYFVLLGTKTNAEAIMSNNTSNTNAYSTVQAQAASLRSSLSTVKTILDQEVVYTKVITNIASSIPTGVVLESLTLSPTTFGQPVTLQAHAKTTDAAIALKQQFQSSPLFSGVTFQSLSSATTALSDGYPISVTLSLTINKGAAK